MCMVHVKSPSRLSLEPEAGCQLFRADAGRMEQPSSAVNITVKGLCWRMFLVSYFLVVETVASVRGCFQQLLWL